VERVVAGASARRDVDGVETPKLARKAVVAADEEELVRVGVLGAEPVLAGYHAPPERDAAERDRTPLAQRRQLVIPPAVVLPNACVAPEEILGKLPRPEGVDAAFMAMERRRLAVCRTPRLEAPSSGPAHVVPRKRLDAMIGSVWISFTRRSGSRRDRFLDWLFCRRRDRHRLLERYDLDFSFRVGRAYLHCCLPEATLGLDSCSVRQESATRGKSYRGGWTAPEAISCSVGPVQHA